MRVAVLTAFLLLTGCSHTAVGISSATSTASTGGASASVQTNSGTLAAVLIMAVFISAAADGTLVPEPAVPEMDPQRKVVEQDCTKPIDMSLGNLRCK